MKNLFPLISLGNEEAPVLRDHSQLVAGSYALANESRLASAIYTEALTQFLVGWKDTENIQSTLDFIAPPVAVTRKFEFKKANNAEEFLSETDDERTIGTAFKRVAYSGTSALARTRNRGLTYRLDRDEEGGAVTEEMITGRLAARIMRNKLRRAVTALLALDAGTPKVWNAASTPDEDIRSLVADAQLASGIFPNRALVGLAAWNLRAGAYSAQNNAGAYAAIGKSSTEVAQLLGLDDMRISRELYQFSGTEKKRIMTSNLVAFYAVDGIGKDDPSNLKQFYTPVEGGGRWRVYREEIGPKFVDITVEHYDEIVGTSTVGAKKLNIASA